MFIASKYINGNNKFQNSYQQFMQNTQHVIEHKFTHLTWQLSQISNNQHQTHKNTTIVNKT